MIKELNYTWTQEDIKHYGEDLLSLKDDLKSLPQNKLCLKVYIIKFLLSIFIISAVFLLIWLNNYVILLSILIIFFILLSIIAKKGFIIPLPLSKKIKQLNQKLIIDSDSDDVMTNTEDGKNSVVFKWNDIKKVYNTENNILLFRMRNDAFIIPKRIFNSEEELNETWNLIQECYNKSR